MNIYLFTNMMKTEKTQLEVCFDLERENLIVANFARKPPFFENRNLFIIWELFMRSAELRIKSKQKQIK